MRYQIRRTSQFKKDYKCAIKRGLAIEKLDRAIELLAKDGFLPPEYNDHPLARDKKGLRECHIEPDWLLVYEIDHGILVTVPCVGFSFNGNAFRLVLIVQRQNTNPPASTTAFVFGTNWRANCFILVNYR